MLALQEKIGEVEKKQNILEIHEKKEDAFKAAYDALLQTVALIAGFLEQNSIITV